VSAPEPVLEDPGDLAALIGERARNLFATRQMHCSEAVLTALNRSLGGGLETFQALALAGPFSEGVSGSGCMCGALGGALMAIGLFIGGTRPLQHRGKVQRAAERLTADFKARTGGPCCRILSRRSPAGVTHFQHCADLTALGATLAAGLILAHRPELEAALDRAFVATRDSLPAGILKRAIRCTGFSV
jgi:C_GCAxxG_C_C family probable redox protein